MLKRLLPALCAMLLATGMVAAKPEIRSFTPFTTDTGMRIDLTVACHGKATAEVTGRIASPDGEVLWQGVVVKGDLVAGENGLSATIDGIRPRLWSPATPHLYTLELTLGEQTVRKQVGFRRFEMRDGRFYLNGQPIFLRGNAINPPGRGIPAGLETSREFARDYVRFLKGMNVNMIRIPDNQTWMEVCDQEGMMIFAGRYGRPTGATADGPPADLQQAVRAYIEKDLGPFASHPSVMVYVMSNEMPHGGKLGDAYRDFLKQAYDELIRWDHTRQYICNAGYGLGRSADIYDVHRYWGWYYNTYLTFLNLRDVEMWQNPGRTQAVTFTECVGNYTGIDGRYNLCSRTKQPGSQLCWTGHAPDSGPGALALDYQAEVLKNVTEMFRRLRARNPYLSGVMPFTILFHDWDGIGSFAEMRPKPAAYQYGESYAPVLLSWEAWQGNVFAGAAFGVTAHVVNDDDQFRSLTGACVEWSLEGASRLPVCRGEIALPEVPYYGTFSKKLQIAVPASVPTGEYTLKGTIMQGNRVVSVNRTPVFVAGGDWKRPVAVQRAVQLYDPQGTFGAVLERMGVAYEQVTGLKRLREGGLLIVADRALKGGFDAKALQRFTQDGGRVLCLRQNDPAFARGWLPVEIQTLSESNNDPTYLSPSYRYADGMNANIERPEHPVFEGLGRGDFGLWSDYTDFDESRAGFPAVYPVTDGFVVRGDAALVTTLANYGRSLAAAALCEVACGKGSAILSGFDLTQRYGADPRASRLLENLVRYAASDAAPQPFLPVAQTIFWGDYASERGIVTGDFNGLIVNTYPIVPAGQAESLPVQTDAQGYQYGGGYGGWNTRPGVQYVGRGRRPFAPFSFSAGGSIVVAAADQGKPGTGFFLARIPNAAKTMETVFENSSDEAIAVSIKINNLPEQTHTIPPGGHYTASSPLPAERDVTVTFMGDRRCVILTTKFV